MSPILNYPQLHKMRLSITERKWKDLQDIKSVISQECHTFYDLLPYAKQKNTENETDERDEPERKKTKRKNNHLLLLL